MGLLQNLHNFLNANQGGAGKLYRSGFGQNVRELPRGIASAIDNVTDISGAQRIQRQIDSENEKIRTRVLTKARREADPIKRQKMIEIARRVENPNVAAEVNPNIMDAGYAKRMGGTLFDVGTAIAAPALSMPRGIAARVAGNQLAKLGAYGALRGVEGAAFQAGRDAFTEKKFDPRAIANAALMGAAFNTALSPRVAGGAAKEVAGNVRKAFTIDPQTGKLLAKPGFAKLPGGEKSQLTGQLEIPGLPPKAPIQVTPKVSHTDRAVKVKLRAAGDIPINEVKDISSAQASLKDVYRNFDTAFGKNAEAVKRRVLTPLDEGKGRFAQEQISELNRLKSEVVDRFGIKKGSKESALVQRFGEGKINLDQLKKQTPKWREVVEGDKWFRGEYDRQINEINAVQAEIYPNQPDKLIPKRKDYYRHFQELEGVEGLKNVIEGPNNIPTELSGVSDVTKPRSKFLSLAQRRMGDKTKEDAVGGYLNYVQGAAYRKHIDPAISGFRNLSAELRDRAVTEGTGTEASRFVEFLDDYANDLAGKTNPFDRSMQKLVGRPIMGVLDWVNRRVKANQIVGNLSSSVAQFGNFPQIASEVNPVNLGKGVFDNLGSIFKPNPNIAKSAFIKERYLRSAYDQFETGILGSTKRFAGWVTGVLDEAATKTGWHAIYNEAVAKGVPNPVKFADDRIRMLVAGRGVGEVPLAQKARSFQLIAPFQLEVQNLWNVLGERIGKKEFGKLVGFMVASYAFNKGAKAVRGSGVTLDPIQAGVDAYNAYQEEEDKKIGALRAGGRLAGEGLSNVIGGQTLAALYPEYGTSVGGEKVTREELFGDKDPTRFGSGLLAAGAVTDPLYKLVPSYGGAQIKKTVEGLKSTNQGYSETKGGKVQFPIEKSAGNAIKAALFGKYATKEGRNYIADDLKTLGEDQSETFKALGGDKDYYNSVIDKRKIEAADDKAKAKIKGKPDGKAMAASTEGIGKLPSGKVYVKSLDKTFDTEAEAKKEIAKDKFKKSDKNFEEYGDSVFRKSKSGDVTVQPKLEFEEQLSTALLTKFKKEGDYAKWRETAEMRGRQLQELINDPSIDELERIKLENEFATLEESYAKYKNYGGKFKKGKKGKKAKIVKASGDVTTASQLIKFARPSAPKSKKIALNSPRVKLASLKAPKPQSSKITPVSGRRIKIKK